MAHKIQNADSARRSLTHDFEQLESVHSAAKKRTTGHRYKRWTYQAFEAHYKDPMHGALSEEQRKEKWQDLTSKQDHVDCNGVVNGVAGFRPANLACFLIEIFGACANECVQMSCLGLASWQALSGAAQRILREAKAFTKMRRR